MGSKEYDPSPRYDQGEEERLQPFELPAELAEYLAGQEYAMLLYDSDQGTVFVVKAPGREIRSIAGRVPIEVKHELFQHPLAPIIRTVVRIYDQPDRPLALETFTNVEDPVQWGEYAQLCLREEFDFLFYDETLSHRLTKRVRNTAGEHMANILNYADRVKASIPEDMYDFDQAKDDVLARTSL